MAELSRWNKYRRKGLAEMRTHIPGEDMAGISVSPEDRQSVFVMGAPGGMIARNPANHADRWYVAKDYFEENFEQVEESQHQ